MNLRQIRRPSPATVIATAALVVAMGGTAEAVRTRTLVHKRDIARGAVTAKALAKGAVHPKAIAAGAVKATAISRGAVGSGALAPGAVTAGSIASGAVTSGALAPGSVDGAALGQTSFYSAAIKDLDVAPENPVWTASDTVAVSCASGERVISGGVVFTNPGNREVAIVQSTPFVNGNSQGWVGQISTNSGGTASAEVQVLCLK
jgi:hypothetical protein